MTNRRRFIYLTAGTAAFVASSRGDLPAPPAPAAPLSAALPNLRVTTTTASSLHAKVPLSDLQNLVARGQSIPAASSIHADGSTLTFQHANLKVVLTIV